MILKAVFMSIRLTLTLTALLIISFINPCLSFSQVKRPINNIDKDFLLPDKMTLCGETDAL
jgi:hypothetical protein